MVLSDGRVVVCSLPWAARCAPRQGLRALYSDPRGPPCRLLRLPPAQAHSKALPPRGITPSWAELIDSGCRRRCRESPEDDADRRANERPQRSTMPKGLPPSSALIRVMGYRSFPGAPNQTLHAANQKPEEPSRLPQGALPTASQDRNLFTKLKDWRRISTRYDGCAQCLLLGHLSNGSR